MITEQDKERLAPIGGVVLSSLAGLWNSFELAERCILEQIEGDFAELGVFAGGQCAAMAMACVKHRVARRIHLFDSFCGIPKCSANDCDAWDSYGQQPAGAPLQSSGKASCSLAAVQNYMRQFGVPRSLLVYHEGWFQDTLPRDFPSIDKLALLRFDCDLYDSTVVGMEWAYPRVVDGGFIISDDYGSQLCRRAVAEGLARLGETHAPQVVVGNEPTSWWRRQKSRRT